MENKKTTTEIATIEQVRLLSVFPVGKTDSIINIIRKDALSIVPDTSTVKGRKEIASTAYKVAQSKTYLDKLGVKCKEEAQKKVRAVDEERRSVRERLDELKEEVRSPLTLWEMEEKARIAKEKAEIEYNASFDAAIIENDLFIRQKEIELKEAAIAKAEAEMAEKEKKVAEIAAIEKERIDFEEKTKREAINAAELEEGEKVRVADLALVNAQEKSLRDIQNERENKELSEKERTAEENRKNDIEHKTLIYKEALSSLLLIGLERDTAKLTLSAIVKGKIKNVAISFQK